MNQAQLQQEVYIALKQQVDAYIQQNQISPSIVDGALNKVLADVKDKVIEELVYGFYADKQKEQEQASIPKEEEKAEEKEE